ncbi:PEP-CTERM domain protein [Sphingomonas sp. Leaf343]|nr:PEP-CTERM domain protein [Sphingomonas sp. Leaf343]
MTFSVMTVPAGAVTFKLNNLGGAGAGTQARAGFDMAAAYWSSILTNNVTINLDIGFSRLGPNVIGGTASAATPLFNSQVYQALRSTATSSVDALAISSLQTLKASPYGDQQLTVTTNYLNAAGNGYLDKYTRVVDKPIITNIGLLTNTALAKAMGQTISATGLPIDYAATDGRVLFSSDFDFDFDPRDGISSKSVDFLGVAIHEIGHALGFVSGVDTYDTYTSPGSLQRMNLDNFVFMHPLDLFRYSSEGVIDWSTQNTPYFSIDGGKSQLFGDSRMSTGTYNGDKRQASHFRDSLAGAPQLGIMDPTVSNGQMAEVTALDIAAFDAMGWTTRFDALRQPGYRFSTADIYRSLSGAVPEPATWAMMCSGVGMIGGSLRRRKRAVATQTA